MMLRSLCHKLLHQNCVSYILRRNNKQFSTYNTWMTNCGGADNGCDPSKQRNTVTHSVVRFLHVANEKSCDIDSANSMQSLSNVEDGQSLTDYGLGSWRYPHHWLQNLMDYLHLNLDVGWMPTIAIVTVALRFLAIPTYIKMRQFNTKSQNHFPEQSEFQMRIITAVNPVEKAKAKMEFMEFLKKNDLNPIKPLLYSLPMGAIFISFFAALRGIIAADVPSFISGGMLWFSNLAVPDPYYVLPLLSCLSLHILIRSGAATAEIGPASAMPAMQKVLFWSPVALFPFIMSQPACMFVFWITSNSFSLLLMYLFANPKMKKLFGIPQTIVHPVSIKVTMNHHMKSLKNAKERENIRQQAFRKAQKHMELMNKHSQDAKKKQPSKTD